QVAELVLRDQTLPGRQGNLDLLLQPRHRGDVLGAQRFFVEQGAEGLDHLGQLLRPNPLKDLSMGIERDVDVFADGATQKLHPCARLAQRLSPRHLLKMIRQRIRFERRKALLLNDVAQTVFDFRWRSPSAGPRIYPDAVAAAPSQKLV